MQAGSIGLLHFATFGLFVSVMYGLLTIHQFAKYMIRDIVGSGKSAKVSDGMSVSDNTSATTTSSPDRSASPPPGETLSPPPETGRKLSTGSVEA